MRRHGTAICVAERQLGIDYARCPGAPVVGIIAWLAAVVPQLVVETEIGFDLDVRIGFGDLKAIEITRGSPVENGAITATDNRDVGHDR